MQNQHTFQRKFFTIDLLPTALGNSSTTPSVALDAVENVFDSWEFKIELAPQPANGNNGFHVARSKGYTSRMDAVRFGRALGFGARQAVKTVTAAVSAATAESPSAQCAVTGTSAGSAAPRPQVRPAADSINTAAHKASHQAAQTVIKARGAREGLRRGSRRFGGPAWKTFTRLGGVLWLEVSGVFFGLFALFALAAVVHLRGEWHRSAAGHRQLVVAVAMLAFFGYFCVSNFVLARRRERRR